MGVVAGENTAHGTRSAPGVRDRIDAKTAMEETFKRYEQEAAKK